jgi:hypothetical protein
MFFCIWFIDSPFYLVANFIALYFLLNIKFLAKRKREFVVKFVIGLMGL